MTDDLDKTTISPPGEYEPAPDAAPAASVLPPDPASRGARRRWTIAVGIVAVVVVASAFAFSLFTGRAANAVVLGYVPEDSIMYGEVRMDLPGDQRANVGAFLSKFPGFADQSTLETKIDEVLDRLIGDASGGTQTFSGDVKPWFGGQLAFSLGALPDPGVVTTDPTVMGDSRFLVLVSVKDEALARTWFDAAVAETGSATSSESYGGANLTVIEGQGAYALLGGKVAVVGDLASVRAAVDTNGNSGFAAKPEPAAALQGPTGDHVGFVYIAVRPLLEFSSQLGEAEGVPSPGDAIMGLVPEWMAFAVRVEGDALRMEAFAPTAEGAPGPSDNRTSTVADHVPANAVFVGIGHDYGKTLLDTLDTYRADPTLKPAVEMVDEAAGILGGPNAAVGWIGDLAVTVTRGERAPEGGLIIVPTDSAAAGQLFTSLRTLVSLGGAAMGVSVRDEPYAGTTITIVDLGEIGDLIGQAGVPTDILAPGALPTGRVELAYAVTDQVVVIGSGPGFVKHVLDTTQGTSLASNERYKALAGRIGQGTGSTFVDVTAIREAIESSMLGADAADVAEYEESVKPFLTPFDALIGTNSVDGGVTRSTYIVTVK
jgi:uncharacterized protein DUF3352